MRASCGCLVEDGTVLHGYDGPCSLPSEPEPTAEDYCAAEGHLPYRDGDRCYCGAVVHGSPDQRTPRESAEAFSQSVIARLEAALDAARCPGRGTDGHGMTHCAECCFGSGWMATSEDDLALLDAASDALLLVKLLAEGNAR